MIIVDVKFTGFQQFGHENIRKYQTYDRESEVKSYQKNVYGQSINGTTYHG